MIRLRNILELITIVWRSKRKTYLLLASTTNLEIARITEFATYEAASKKQLELMRTGDVIASRIVIEITFMKVKKDMRK